MQSIMTFTAARTVLVAAAMLTAVLVQPASQAAAQSSEARSESPVVVELFTSQGCSSCPPADAFLGELAGQPGVIALSMHVDYWDYIGWKDPFADPKMTERQRDYARALSSRYVYTPQMVIDGRYDVVGSHKDDVRSRIADAAATPKPLQLRVLPDGGGAVAIPAGEVPEGGATIWLAVYDDAHETEILRGENRGKTLRYSHVVRELEQIGTWDGTAMEIPLDLPAAVQRGRDGCAIIVQAGRGGPVLGAVAMDLSGEG